MSNDSLSLDIKHIGGWTQKLILHLLQNCGICLKDSVVAAKSSESTAPNLFKTKQYFVMKLGMDGAGHGHILVFQNIVQTMNQMMLIAHPCHLFPHFQYSHLTERSGNIDRLNSGSNHA